MMNIQKFLGIRDPQKPYKKGTFVDESKQYSPRVERKVTKTTTLKALMSIRTKVLTIENILKRILGVDKKSAEQKKRVQLVQEQDKRGGRPEKIQPLIGGIIKPPRLGIMDAIKNFVLFTFLGWLSQFLLPHIDKLKPVVEFFGKALDIFDFVFKHILGGIGNFIKFGYDTWDTINDKVDDIKKAGSDIQNVFDETVESIGKIFDGTIEIANSFLKIFGAADPSIAQSVSVPSADTTSSESPQLSPLPQITTFQSGGRIGPSTPITRGIQPEESRRSILIPPSAQPQKTIPGKDVGGADKIKELYGSSNQSGAFWFNLFSTSQEKDAFSALTQASSELKQRRTDDFLGLGNLMGASVDIALGQKPEKRTYQQFAEGIKYLIDYRITKPEEFERLNLEQMIENMVETKVDSAINKIRQQVAKRSTVTSPGTGADPGFSPSGLSGGIAPGDITEDEMDLFIRMVYAEAGGEGDIGMALVARSILNRLGLIQSGKVTPGEFLSQGKSLTEIFNGPRQYQPMLDGRINRQLTESQRNQAINAIMMAQNPTQLVEKLRSEGLSENDITRLMASTGFRNYVAGAEIDPSQQVNEVRFKRHTFNTAGNTMLLVPNEIVAIQQTQTSAFDGGVLPSENIGSKAGMRTHPITGEFRMHGGNDYPMPEGTPITILKDGVVTRSEVNGSLTSGYGNLIEIQHSDGSKSVYAHLFDRRVSVGDKISAGTIIGAVGSTGGSTGPHLHFEYDDPNGNTITNWQTLNSVADRKFRFGDNVKPSVNYKLAIKNGEEGIIENGQWKKQTWTEAERQRYNQQSSQPQMRKGGLIFSNNQNILNPPEKYASYNQPSTPTKVFIQPVLIQNMIPSSASQSISFPTARVNSSSVSSLTRN